MNERMKRFLEASQLSGGFASPYEAGYHCGIHGANTSNCHFGIFSTRERTAEWERGKRDAEAAKSRSE